MVRSVPRDAAKELTKWYMTAMSRMSHEPSAATAQASAEVKLIFDHALASNAFMHAYNDRANPLSQVFAVMPELSSLVIALHKYHNVTLAAESCDSFYHANQAQINRLLEELAPALGNMKWLFSSPKAKVTAEGAFDLLQEYRVGAYGAQCNQLLNDLHPKAELDPEAARKSFQDNPGQYLADLQKCDSVPNIADVLGATSVWPTGAALAALEAARMVLAASPAPLEHAVREAVEAYRDEKLHAIFRSTSIDQLTRQLNSGRVSALRRAGINSVADLAAKSTFNLCDINGIGWTTACDISRAVDDMKEHVRKKLKIQLSADTRTTKSSALVLSLHRVLLLRSNQASSREWLDQHGAEVEISSATLAKMRTSVDWFFSTRQEKDEFDRAYNQLQEVAQSDATQGLRQTAEVLSLLPTQDETTPSDTAEAWRAFSDDPIPFLNLLEELCPGALGNDESFTLGLPKELTEEIQKTSYSLEGLKCSLRRYQEWGLKYILHQGDVLLGDEMGLGKTVEAIAAMVALRNTGATHFLVICPASVIPNWCREITKHSNLSPIKVHGQSKKEAIALWQKNGGVAVTNYESTSSLMGNTPLRIDLLVVDEAHYVKNPDANRSKNVAVIGECASRRLFMTGTALENRVDEMISLISYLRPDVAKEAESLATFEDADVFKNTIAPVYYRRRRQDVLSELPELVETDAWCTLSPEETKRYEDAVLAGDRTAARRVSWTEPDLGKSSKMNRLREIIEEAQGENRKVLVFSFYLATIRAICEEFKDSALGPIKGSVAPLARQRILDQFAESADKTVLVCQINSGGTGLNIQSASVVVICEPQYKPSTETQAISRAYRMGQARNVLVYRLLAENTLDERIHNLLQSKQYTFDVFADESVAAQEETQLTDDDVSSLIEQEVTRIRQKRAQTGADAPSGRSKRNTPKPRANGSSRRAKTALTKQVRFSVAGLNVMGTGEDWLAATKYSVIAVREASNPHDKNAIALRQFGHTIGYVPRKTAREIAPLLDQGYTMEITSVSADEKAEELYEDDGFGGYVYRNDSRHTFYVATVTAVIK